MKRKTIHRLVTLTALVIAVLGVTALVVYSAKAAGTAYYVDCSAAANGTGTQASPWNNLATPTARTFVAGDSIFLKRGTTCNGMLYPKGSGTAAAPITIGAYGSGALPIINGGTNVAAVQLINQQGWHIQDIETTGGATYGIYIGNTASATLTHFRVTNVVVHDVAGEAAGKQDGLIYIATSWRKSGIIQDVIVDGATAYNTHRWNGIKIMCTGSMSHPATQPVIIRNSSVHSVYGDGIVIYSCSNGLIENSVAWDTGNIATDSHGTPNGIWTWSCKDCVVQYNEAYLSHSPAVDGGAYDIDYPAVNNTVQYNYGHDNDSYCVAILGAERAGTINSIVRYNICSNNCQETDSPDGSSSRFGEFDIFTWANGWLDGVAIYNNTVYWNPWDGATWPAFCNGCIDGWPATFKGTLPNFFKNNIIYSTSPNLVGSLTLGNMQLDNNIYWYTGTGNPMFAYGGTTWGATTHYTSFAAYQAGSGQDQHSYYVDPQMVNPTSHDNGMPTNNFTLLPGSLAINHGADLVAQGLQTSMGTRDFYGNSIPNGAYDIGAHEYGGAPLPTTTPTVGPSPTFTNTPGGPTNTPIPPTSTPTNTPIPGGSLFFDGFEDGSMADWSPTNNAQVKTVPYQGVYSAGAKLAGSFSRTISTAGYSGIHVRYAVKTSLLDAGEYLKVEWYNGSTWTVLEQLQSEGTWTLRDWTLPAGAANNPAFALRFSCSASGNTEWVYVDNIEITGH